MNFAGLIESLRGWSKWSTHDGVRLVAPDPEAGTIAVHGRVPLRPFAEIVGGLARDEWRSRQEPRIGRGRLFVTLEGEHACLAPVTAEGAAAHWVALVVGDEHGAVIDGTGAAADLELVGQRVRALADNYFLALGENRQRRFEYAPPQGWEPLPRVHATRYLHPEFPRKQATIQVFHARPSALTAPEVEDRLLYVDNTSLVKREPPNPPVAFQSQGGLVGQLIRCEGTSRGADMTFLTAGMTDDRYTYLVQLEARAELYDAALPALVELVDTIRPVPHGRVKQSSSSLIHWVE